MLCILRWWLLSLSKHLNLLAGGPSFLLNSFTFSLTRIAHVHFILLAGLIVVLRLRINLLQAFLECDERAQLVSLMLGHLRKFKVLHRILITIINFLSLLLLLLLLSGLCLLQFKFVTLHF
jgi:hypothetical protein